MSNKREEEYMTIFLLCIIAILVIVILGLLMSWPSIYIKLAIALSSFIVGFFIGIIQE